MKKYVLAAIASLIFILSLTGCGSSEPKEAEAPAVVEKIPEKFPAPAAEEKDAEEKQDAPAAEEVAAKETVAEETAAGAEAKNPDETADETPEAEADSGNTGATADTGRADGERFEEIIMLEGMEEPVGYEHAKSDALGFELDFEYDYFVRHSEADREYFVADGEDPADPWNYFEIKYNQANANMAADAMSAVLSDAYDTVESEEYTLDQAGQCICISASGAKDGKAPFGSLQNVYIIPTGEGSLVAEVHCTLESAEGYGSRALYSLNTLSLIGR